MYSGLVLYHRELSPEHFIEKLMRLYIDLCSRYSREICAKCPEHIAVSTREAALCGLHFAERELAKENPEYVRAEALYSLDVAEKYRDMYRRAVSEGDIEELYKVVDAVARNLLVLDRDFVYRELGKDVEAAWEIAQEMLKSRDVCECIDRVVNKVLDLVEKGKLPRKVLRQMML